MKRLLLLLCCVLAIPLASAADKSPLHGLPGFSQDDDVATFHGAALSQEERNVEDRKRDKRRLQEKLTALEKAIATSGLDPLQQKSIQAVLAEVGKRDTRRTLDQMDPKFARLLIADGWLARAVPQLADELGRLQQSLDKAMELSVKTAWTTDAYRILAVSDIWNRGGFVITDQATGSSELFIRPPQPFYDQRSSITACWVRIAIDPSGGDEAAILAALAPKALAASTSIALVNGGEVLASWTEADGFNADLAVWRERFPVGGGPVLADRFPPHIPLPDMQGGIQGLIVPAGVLRPPTTRDEAGGSAFLDQAAELLPTPGELDLLGNYMVRYVYDSPDSSMPLLIGNRDIKSDIHQTALQTLATVSGGICRGDCDDLSELYQTILERQGHLAHVIMLPSHAAVAFAEQQQDQWTVRVMQTGPSYAFTAERLQDALGMAYKHFDAADNFDPDGLGLLLRFSGEQTRGPWRLSWRIFAEPDYAATMIGVQRDWHYQTYLQGIEKMLSLVEAGDDDTANYRELGGLYAFTGQWDKCIEAMRTALEKTDNPIGRMEVELEIAMHLVSAEQNDEALAIIDRLVDEELPAHKAEMGMGVLQYSLKLAGIALAAGDSDRAIGIIHANTLGAAVQIARQIATLIKQGAHKNQEVWMLNPQVSMLRRLLGSIMGSSLAALEEPAPETSDETAQTKRKQLRAVVDAWVAEIVMADVEEEAEVLNGYSKVGRLWLIDEGLETVLAALEAAPFPGEEAVDHIALAAQRDREPQIPWIKLSLPFYAQLVSELCIDVDQAPDRAVLSRIDALVQAATAEMAKRDLMGPFQRFRAHTTNVILAMVLGDEARLRGLLKEVTRLDHKNTRDTTAQLMGDVAPLVDPAFFATALQLWVDEVDYKAKYYWIAWRAALAGDNAKALAAAKVAAERYADDAAFTEEYAFMQKLLQP